MSNGQVVSVLHLPDLTPVPPEQVNQFYQVTLDSVFAIVRQAMDADAGMISAHYDPQWGYPTDVAIDYVRHAADEELSFTTTLPKALDDPGAPVYSCKVTYKNTDSMHLMNTRNFSLRPPVTAAIPLMGGDRAK